MVGQHLAKNEMYELYPRKWLLIKEPVQSKSTAEILSGELMGVYEEREHAYYEAGKLKPLPRCFAVISSLQED
ncbi:MAG: hypothetical protein FWC89_02935 [Defluviitaleaceae bacterium]|nr:hypothetical protein [Defluviitaleaceae bacterium]